MKEFDDLKFHGIRNRQKYLEGTDKWVIRELETDILMDSGIKEKRQQARDGISLIRDSINYEQISHLTIEFN